MKGVPCYVVVTVNSDTVKTHLCSCNVCIFVKVHLSTFRVSRDAVFSILLSAKHFDPGGLLQ